MPSFPAKRLQPAQQPIMQEEEEGVGASPPWRASTGLSAAIPRSLRSLRDFRYNPLRVPPSGRLWKNTRRGISGQKKEVKKAREKY
jgi:hypothetical protein